MLLAPRDEVERQRGVDDAEHEPGAPGARDVTERTPRCATKPSRSAAAIASRKNISVAGSKSSTATLMKTYEAPQTAARRPSSGQ